MDLSFLNQTEYLLDVWARYVADNPAAPALTDERRLRSAVGNRLDIKRIGESDAIASDRPARAHGKTVLTVNAKLFILCPDGRHSVGSSRQNVNYAVAHTRATRYALFPVDVYHFDSIPR